MPSTDPPARYLPARAAYLAVWIGLVLYAILGAPQGDGEATGVLVEKLLRFQLEGVEVGIAVVWNLVGVFWMAYAWLLVGEWHVNRVSAPLAIVGSLFVGAFAILPYLVWRRPVVTANPRPSAYTRRLLHPTTARILGAFLTLGAIGCVVWAMVAADPSAFGEAMRTSSFVHVMTIDLTLLVLIQPVLWRDAARRRADRRSWLPYLVWCPPIAAVGMPFLLVRAGGE